MIFWNQYWYSNEHGVCERLHTIVCDCRVIFAVHTSIEIKILSVEECDDLIRNASCVVMNNCKVFVPSHPTVRIYDQSDLVKFFSSFGLLTLTGPYLDIYNKIGLLLTL